MSALSIVWPEFARYRAEHQLGYASGLLSLVLGGQVDEAHRPAALSQIIYYARRSAEALPTDPRPPLMESTALLIMGDGPGARRVLSTAIHHQERPELTINYGRALGIAGDEAGAQAAFLRTAWVNPLGISTLPRAMRDNLLSRTLILEQELREGKLKEAPALTMDLAISR